MMLLIDNREPKSLINYLISLNNSDTIKIKYEVKPLDIGDYIIYDEINKTNIVIFERKSLKDLEASIKDGRYNEQSHRLNNSLVHNHNIYYIIEGSIINYKNNSFKNTLYSTLTSLSYYKGFSIINSLNDIESMEIIYRFLHKLLREKDKKPYYSNVSNSILYDEESKETNDYIDVVKSCKKSNITTDNINTIMLMQIPGVSVHSAKSIINTFKTIHNLTCILINNSNCLDDIRLESNNRKISRNTIDNIKKYLLNNELIIDVNTN